MSSWRARMYRLCLISIREGTLCHAMHHNYYYILFSSIKNHYLHHERHHKNPYSVRLILRWKSMGFNVFNGSFGHLLTTNEHKILWLSRNSTSARTLCNTSKTPRTSTYMIEYSVNAFPWFTQNVSFQDFPSRKNTLRNFIVFKRHENPVLVHG